MYIVLENYFLYFSSKTYVVGTQKNHLNLKKNSLSGPMMLLYVSYVYHMISGMIKVVMSVFEIYVADVISRQHIRDKNY